MEHPSRKYLECFSPVGSTALMGVYCALDSTPEGGADLTLQQTGGINQAFSLVGSFDLLTLPA